MKRRSVIFGILLPAVCILVGALSIFFSGALYGHSVRSGQAAHAVFSAGALYGQWTEQNGGQVAHAAEATHQLPLEQLRELAEIFAIIKANYVEEVPSEQLIEQAMRGMVSALDPHSAYLNEDDLAGFQSGLTGKEYGGIGIYIDTKDGWISVLSPIYDTPAYRAGMDSGDLILKIDGVSTQGMVVDDAVNKMRGEIDTMLKLEVLPAGGGDVRQVELVREKVVTPSVMSSLIGDGYGYVRITRFQDKTVDDFIQNVNGMYEENKTPLRGLILDLRNNPGGYLDAGVAVASAFLPNGATVVTDRGRAHQEKIFLADHSRRPTMKHAAELQNLPLVALVNNGSASASEIVAGALQDHNRSVVLGTRTYGKGSVQTVQPLQASKGQTALRLTMARYFTPLGRNIQGRGIAPDIVVRRARAKTEISEEDEGFTLREADLPGHLENSSEEDAGAKATTRPPFVGEDDYQYEQALLALRAMSISNGRQ